MTNKRRRTSPPKPPTTKPTPADKSLQEPSTAAESRSNSADKSLFKPSATAIVLATEPSTPADKPPVSAVESMKSEMKHQCSEAMKAVRNGSYDRALKVIQEAISNFNESEHNRKLMPHLHFIEARVHNHLAENAPSEYDMKAHLSRAFQLLKLSRNALFPYSVSFSLLFLEILYKLAMINRNCWDQMISFCNRALSVTNPIDPGIDDFLDPGEMKKESETRDSRISFAKEGIRKILEDCQLESCRDTIMKKRDKVDNLCKSWMAEKGKTIVFEGNGSSEEKKGFRKLSMKTLIDHCKMNFQLDISEDVGFAKDTSWSYIKCRCGNKFSSENYGKHYNQSHRMQLKVSLDRMIKEIKVQSPCDEIRFPESVDGKPQLILKQIMEQFQKLSNRNLLACKHLEWPILYALDRKQMIFPIPSISPANLQFLAFSDCAHLTEILTWVKGLVRACGLLDSKETVEFVKNYPSDLDSEAKGRIFYSSDMPCLLADESLLTKELSDLEGLQKAIESWRRDMSSREDKAKVVWQILDKEYACLEEICNDRIKMMRDLSLILQSDSKFREETDQSQRRETQVEAYERLLKQKTELTGKAGFRKEDQVIIENLNDLRAAEGLMALTPDENKGEDLPLKEKSGNHFRFLEQRKAKQVIKDIAFCGCKNFM